MSIIIEYRYATVISTFSTAGIGLPVTTLLTTVYWLLLSLYQVKELTTKFCLFYFSHLDHYPNQATVKTSLGTHLNYAISLFLRDNIMAFSSVNGCFIILKWEYHLLV